MARSANCPDCGSELASEPLIQGLCPQCLMSLALLESELETQPTLDGSALGQVLADRYQMRELLGRGGMGEVWRAFDLKLRVDVALKALRPERLASERARELLRQEVRSAREVVSPNVCRIFDLVVEEDQELVSMELVDGVTLAETLRDRGPLPIEEAREIASQFLSGLEAIHQAGQRHRRGESRDEQLLQPQLSGSVGIRRPPPRDDRSQTVLLGRIARADPPALRVISPGRAVPKAQSGGSVMVHPAARRSLFAISSAGTLAALAACVPQPENLRILTYNTAFLYAEIEHPSPVPPPELPLTACVSCNPFGIPPVSVTGTLFCECWPSASLWPNDHRYANISESDRAHRIADRILATDQDVVVLNEVFHPDARQVFVDRLAGTGPYDSYISKLRGHAPVEGLTLGDLIQMAAGELNPILEVILGDLPEIVDYRAVSADSGLMIFSRHAFMTLQGPSVPNDADCPDPECEFSGQNGLLPLTVGSFAFDVYPDCEKEDCWASKGVGLVKLNTPGSPSYVAFTHLQADYPEDGVVVPQTRALQYATMRDLIVGGIPSAEIGSASVYLVGDLNTAGFNRVSPENVASREWHDVYNPDSSHGNVADGFFACGNGISTTQTCRFGVNGTRMLTDAWGFETSTTDFGVSNVHDGKRLDYLLHSDPSAPAGSAVRGRCMQHAMIAWDLQADPDGGGGVTWLSDHLPIRGDFGRANRWCSPNDDPMAALPTRNVHLFQFGPTNCAGSGPNPPCDQDEAVTAPQASLVSGGFQWFRIDQAGTYSIHLSAVSRGVGVDYVVYHHTDLSRPIQPFEEEEGEFGVIYSMPEPPYYIRTFAVDSQGQPVRNTSTLGYTLQVHQHLCRSPQDACVVDPGLGRAAPYAYVWPTTVTGDLLTEVRELWWRFKTSGVKGGRLVDRDTDGQLFPAVRMEMEGAGNEPYKCVTTIPPLLQRWNHPLFPSTIEEELEFIATQIDPGDHDWENDGHRDDLRLAPDLPAEQDGELQVWFIKVTRDSSFLDTFNVCNSGMTSWLSYLTDLTYVVSERIQMWAELDDDLGAEDNLRLYMGFDESGPFADPPASASVDRDLEEPDSGSVSELLHDYPAIRGYFVHQTWPNLWEKDEEELLEIWNPLPPPFAGIETLTEWEVSWPLKPTGPVPPPPIPFIQFSDDGNADDADYYYYWYYKLCHLETEPVCSNP